MTADIAFQTTLKQHKQSLTSARKAVFEVLRGSEPLTMAELVASVDSVDRASVYRAVALFEKIGVVQRLQSGWKYKLELTDPYHEDHHHHATCMLCGQTFVLAEDAQIERHIKKLAESIEFKLERHQLELQGYCSNCHSLVED